ncbi:sex peptide receptor-like [Patella vulgata]|uniref:sex peptide receptor-like n=1 Tax=Patella vulgata TaxID=6465 RepID=UPI0021808840|nr:sex peptide receptor-like [Patella vulgata]
MDETALEMTGVMEFGEMQMAANNSSHAIPSLPTPLHILDKFPENYAVIINGYLSPILVFLTIVTNSLVCIVLLKRNMRSPTNTLLVGMAISDMLTGVFPLPIFLQFFATDRLREYIPYSWCYAYMYLAEYIPTIFHTASIWLTMALAIQRYIYVCHSFKARVWCTIPNAILVSIGVYVIATLSQLSRFFEVSFFPIEVSSNVHVNQTVVGCVQMYASWVLLDMKIYMSIYFWFRVLFIHLIPCSFLVVMNALLIYAMRVAQVRRMQLLRQNKKSESKKLKDSNCTTLMLVAVVGLFLLVEFPLGILMIIMIISNTFDINIIEPHTLKTLSIFSNLFILLSYPLNFFIYCGMSKQFRETFKRLFIGGQAPMDREYSAYMTLPTGTENGKTAVTTGNETAL